MHDADTDNEPKAEVSRSGDTVRIALTGDWTSAIGQKSDNYAEKLKQLADGNRVVFDLSGVQRMDTVGGWLIVRSADILREQKITVTIEGQSATHDILLKEIAAHDYVSPKAAASTNLLDILAAIGKVTVAVKKDFIEAIAFFGALVSALVRLMFKPQTFRLASLVNQMQQVALHGVPIILLISFLVGCIIAQQGIFQLRTFGATAFVVDLTSILTLRELAVLLTAIMIAGRSGSAYTAELGSMKMSEEIDALRVMGLDPMEVLVVPRILALVIGLPLLTFIASMAGLLGGAITASLYGGISFDVFLTRLHSAIAMNTFFAGLIKAPVMALVIGTIACSEGFAVQGSAESLGRHVTSSVVKSIFMVIVMDGIFAMFYAAINF